MSTYKLTQDELSALDFIGYRYQWSEIVFKNLHGNTLCLDNMTQHDLNEAINIEGLPLLDNRSELFTFLISLEPV